MRDSQKTKVDRWQNAAFGSYLRTDAPITAGQAVTILQESLVRYGFTPPLRGAISLRTYKIKVPKCDPETLDFEIPSKAMTPFVIFHEAAHLLAHLITNRHKLEDSAPHSPLFVTVFSDLLIYGLGLDAGSVLEPLRDHRIRSYNYIKFKEICPRQATTCFPLPRDYSSLPENLHG